MLMAATVGIVLAMWLPGVASASWFVEGSEQTSGSKAVATTAKVDSSFAFTIPSAEGFTAECTASALRALEPALASPGLMQTRGLTFEGCHTTKPASGCELASNTISTNPLYAAPLEGSGGGDLKLLVSAQTKNVITELSISETATCPFQGLFGVKGSVRLDARTLKTEGAPQVLEGLGSTENNSLEIGNSKMYVTGRDLVALAAGQKWSAKPIGLSTDPSSLAFALAPGKKSLTYLVKNAKLELTGKSNSSNYLLEDPGKCLQGSKLSQCTVEIKFLNSKAPSSTYEAAFVGGPSFLTVPIFNSE